MSHHTRRAPVVISFATQPHRGGEGGVGWFFIREMARVCAREQSQLDAIVDSRDVPDLKHALAHEGLSGVVRLREIALPKGAQSILGDRKTRQAYLMWRAGAMAEANRLHRIHGSSALFHQVTFATATLPPAFPQLASTHKVWGPLMVPTNFTAPQGRNPSASQRLALRLIGMGAARSVQKVNRVISINDTTAEWLRRHEIDSEIEPNIFAEPTQSIGPKRENIITYSGLLINRKRPWLAVQAMKSLAQSGLRLEILGDGPLRGSLESYTRQERLEASVSFLGRVSLDESRRLIGSSRALIHPSSREGSPWVVGEAAAAGVPAAVFEGTGADTVARLSDNHSEICEESGDRAQSLARGVQRLLRSPMPQPTDRWSSTRMATLIPHWWGTDNYCELPARTTS